MLCEFGLYLDHQIQLNENEDYPFTTDWWWSIEELLKEEGRGQLYYSLEVVREEALYAAQSEHNTPADREGWKHLYRFLGRLRASQQVRDRAESKKRAVQKRRCSKTCLGDQLKRALAG